MKRSYPSTVTAIPSTKATFFGKPVALAVPRLALIAPTDPEEPSIPWPTTEAEGVALVKAGFAQTDERHEALGREVYRRGLHLDHTRRYDRPMHVRSRRIALLTY